MGRKKVEEHKRKDKRYLIRLDEEDKKHLDILVEYTGESRADLFRYGLNLVWKEIF